MSQRARFSIHVFTMLVAPLAASGCGSAGDAADGGSGGDDASRSDSGTQNDGGLRDDAGNGSSSNDSGSGGNDASPLPDGGTQAGGSCSSATAILCEDFEANDNFKRWRAEAGSAAGNSGTLTRDTVHAHGQGAMHGIVDYINLDSGWAWLRQDLAVAKPDTFARFYAYVPAASVKPVSTWYALGGLYSGRDYAALGLGLENGHLSVIGWGNVTRQPLNDAKPFPADQWVCLEVQYHQTAAVNGEVPGALTVWRNSETVIDAAPFKITGGDTLDAAFFGIYAGGEVRKLEAWLDDVAVSSHRIGCLP